MKFIKLILRFFIGDIFYVGSIDSLPGPLDPSEEAKYIDAEAIKMVMMKLEKYLLNIILD